MKIKTTKRKAWHRAEDRWEWRGHISWFASRRRPEWRDGAWWMAGGEATGHYTTFTNRTTEGHRQRSLRRILPIPGKRAGRK